MPEIWITVIGDPAHLLLMRKFWGLFVFIANDCKHWPDEARGCPLCRICHMSGNIKHDILLVHSALLYQINRVARQDGLRPGSAWAALGTDFCLVLTAGALAVYRENLMISSR